MLIFAALQVWELRTLFLEGDKADLFYLKFPFLQIFLWLKS